MMNVDCGIHKCEFENPQLEYPLDPETPAYRQAGLNPRTLSKELSIDYKEVYSFIAGISSANCS